MNPQTREQRLAADYEALLALRTASTFFELNAQGEPPDRYTLTFRGRGACRAGAARGGVEICEVHRCELRLPFGYPQQPPDVRWLTPLVHPNISFSGFVSWRELDIDWQPETTLDVVCERLWDIARLAYRNPKSVLDRAAQHWLNEHPQIELPLDSRPLRDRTTPPNPNVIQYDRRDGQGLRLTGGQEVEVLFISEETPVPVLPSPRAGDDILYIGDE